MQFAVYGIQVYSNAISRLSNASSTGVFVQLTMTMKCEEGDWAERVDISWPVCSLLFDLLLFT